MSEGLPSKKEALLLLRKSGCSKTVVEHCKSVARVALQMADVFKARRIKVDLELVEAGALLHDIGRSKTHTVHHAIVGAQIAESLGLPKPIISIIKRHVGGGITVKEARRLGWPEDIYMPKTLEEKIIAYADKLVDGSRKVTIERAIGKFISDQSLPRSSITLLRKLHQEMSALLGDCKCP